MWQLPLQKRLMSNYCEGRNSARQARWGTTMKSPFGCLGAQCTQPSLGRNRLKQNDHSGITDWQSLYDSKDYNLSHLDVVARLRFKVDQGLQPNFLMTCKLRLWLDEYEHLSLKFE